jgi:hypothetical protein
MLKTTPSPPRQLVQCSDMSGFGGDLNRSTQHFIAEGKDRLLADKSEISWWYEGGRENYVVG